MHWFNIYWYVFIRDRFLFMPFSRAKSLIHISSVIGQSHALRKSRVAAPAGSRYFCPDPDSCFQCLVTKSITQLIFLNLKIVFFRWYLMSNIEKKTPKNVFFLFFFLRIGFCSFSKFISGSCQSQSGSKNLQKVFRSGWSWS